MGDTRPKAKEPDLFVPLIPDAAQNEVDDAAIDVAHVTIVQSDVVSATRIIQIACPRSTACAKGRPEGLKIIRPLVFIISRTCIRIAIPPCFRAHIIIATTKISDRSHTSPNGLTIVLCTPPGHWAAGLLVSPNAGNCYWCARGALTRAIRRRFRAGIIVLAWIQLTIFPAATITARYALGLQTFLFTGMIYLSRHAPRNALIFNYHPASTRAARFVFILTADIIDPTAVTRIALAI